MHISYIISCINKGLIIVSVKLLIACELVLLNCVLCFNNSMYDH